MVRNSLLILLWLATAVIIAISAYLALNACGLMVWGYRIGQCPSTVNEMTSLQSLQMLADQLERQLILAPCRSSGGMSAISGNISKPQVTDTPGGDPSAAGRTPALPSQISMPSDASSADPMDQEPRSGPLPGASPDSPSSAAPPQASSPAPSDRSGHSTDNRQADQSRATPSNCPSHTSGDSFIFALDRSNSMRIPLAADPVRVERLEREMLSPDPQISRPAERDYEALYLQPGEKRLDRLKTAMIDFVEAKGEAANYVIIPFAGCDRPPSPMTFTGSDRGALIGAIRDIEPAPATPLAKAIEVAVDAAKRSREGSRIVLVTDGMDTCSGDPCAAAQAAGREIPINVIAFGDPGRNSCIATATGGQLIRIDEARDFQAALRDASRTRGGGDACQ